MQKIVITFTLLLSFSVFGQETLWNLILNNNFTTEEALSRLDAPEPALCEVSMGEIGITDLETEGIQCIEKICGTANEVESYQEMIEKAEAASPQKEDAKFITEYDQLMEQISNASIERNKLLQPIYKKIVDSGELEMSEGLLPYIFYKETLFETVNLMIDGLNKENGLEPFFKHEVILSRLYISTDDERIDKNLQKAFKADPNSMQEAVRIGLKSRYAKFFDLILLDTPVPLILDEIETNSDWKDAYREVRTRAKEQLESLPEKLRTPLTDLFKTMSSEELHSAVDQDHFPRQEHIKDTLSFFYGIDFLNTIIESMKTESSAFKRINYKNLIINDMKQFDFDKRGQALSNDKDVKARQKLDFSSCKAQRDFALAALPTKQELQNFQTVWTKTKETFRNHLFPLFSKKSARLLNNKLDQMTAVPPLSREDYKKDIIRDLKTELEDIKTDLEAIKRGSGFEYEAALFSNHPKEPDFDSFFSDDASLSDNIHDLTSVCENYTPESLNDSAYSFYNGSLHSSWNSVKSTQFGTSVLNHELAHLISPYFKSSDTSRRSKRKYRKVRTCLDQNHNKEESSDDQLYTEEDWADMISALITTEPTQNIGCFLAQQKDNSYKREEVILKNSDPGDTHSSHLFRAIQAHLFSNQTLPEECQEYLPKQANPYPTANCRALLDGDT